MLMRVKQIPTVESQRVESTIDAACRSVQCALLTDAQYEVLDALRTEIKSLCDLEMYSEARRVLEVALGLVAGGPPTPE